MGIQLLDQYAARNSYVAHAAAEVCRVPTSTPALVGWGITSENLVYAPAGGKWTYEPGKSFKWTEGTDGTQETPQAAGIIMPAGATVRFTHDGFSWTIEEGSSNVMYFD
jgi:hypothetical protein